MGRGHGSFPLPSRPLCPVAGRVSAVWLPFSLTRKPVAIGVPGRSTEIGRYSRSGVEDRLVVVAASQDVLEDVPSPWYARQPLQ